MGGLNECCSIGAGDFGGGWVDGGGWVGRVGDNGAGMREGLLSQQTMNDLNVNQICHCVYRRDRRSKRSRT